VDVVLFDMDGLLVDTERLWFAVETEVVERLGGSWGPEHQRQLVGGSLKRAVAYMLEHTGADVDPDVVAGWLIEGMERRLTESVDPMPGAMELLTALRDEGIPTGLVTSSRRPLADAVLKHIGREHFDVVVTADDVSHAKPHPEPYLTALAMLSADPARSVALEDSPNGVASAVAAGCRVVAVPSLLPIPEQPGVTVLPALTHADVGVLRSLVG